MKITDIRFSSYLLGQLERPYRNAIVSTTAKALHLVEVDTDEGLSGCSLAGGREQETVEGPLRAQLLGRDPLDAARLWHAMFTGWRKPVAKGDVISAIGSVDNALWDLRGKAWGRPYTGCSGTGCSGTFVTACRRTPPGGTTRRASPPGCSARR